MRLFTMFAVAAMFVCGVVYAQEAGEAENLEYQKLKVLEPMVGTYQVEGRNEETGQVWEMRTTIAWSASKKMLIVTTTRRNAESEAGLASQEWEELNRMYYIWNNGEKRVEHIFVRPGIGTVEINEVKPEGDNVFSYSRISSTANPAWESDIKAIVTEESITYHLTNRKNAAGEALDDAQWTMKRIQE